MAKKTAPLLPATDELLRQFGERLRLARLRRQLTAKQVAERSGMAPMTLRSLERGGAGVTMGAYLAIMQVLGIEKDLNLLGEADPVGRELQDAQLATPTKASRSSAMSSTNRPTIETTRPAVRATAERRRAIKSSPQAQSRETTKTSRKPSADAREWIEQSKFTSAARLASLIDLKATRKKKVR